MLYIFRIGRIYNICYIFNSWQQAKKLGTEIKDSEK